VQPLKYEISAANWLKNFIYTSGYSLQDKVTETSPRQATAYYTSIGPDGNIFTYVSVQITGNLAFITRVDAPLSLKDFVSYIQKHLVDETKITYPKEENIEAEKAFALVDAVKFSYPTTWDALNPDFKDMSKLSVQLQTEDESHAINGYIRFYAVRRNANTSLLQEIEEQKSHFSGFMGIDINKLVSSGKADVSNRFLFSRFEIYEASYQKEGHAAPEIRLAVLGDKEWYIFIYLITPKEQENPTIWARNTRTLDVILKSVK
jgi:hypothetical protein